ncbi:hypothetical protein LPW11_16820 [Geomonas sp. RF6]|uniref:hypothetical protein n=1 Tax=Geomonas sp. RF6 TaxID=2897342 RepID=UPI001E2EA14E|nr:hypothetical protein [Geomonas sp. RF6]UFS69550.1 hypothetical protein LPW11_16820 [Geomonas sp. RF6]
MAASRVLLVILAVALLVQTSPAAASVPPGGADLAADSIRDIRSSAPGPTLPPFTLTAAGLLACATLTLFRRRLRQQKKTVVLPEATERDPSGVVEELAAQYRLGEVDRTELCRRIAEIFREGVAVRSGVPAECLTTQELLDQPGVRTVLGPEHAAARELLALCDRVKFANHRAEAVELDGALETARRLVTNLAEGRHEVP